MWATNTRITIRRDAVRRHLALREFESLRKRMMPFAAAAGYLTDEDVFRDVS
ncbi:MAG: CopG family transcriptional regulator [Planctomycetes bacterium]|nr:CopG family transcriptional regulator [Planctomycetota bacterium]